MSEPSSSQPPVPIKGTPFHSQLPPGTSPLVHSLPKKQQRPEVIDLTSDHDDPQSTQQQIQRKPKRKREKRSRKTRWSHNEQRKQQKLQQSLYIQKGELSQLRSQPRDQTIASPALK